MRAEILKEQNKFNLELSSILLELIEKQQQTIRDCQKLVDSRGASAIEYELRKKIGQLNESEHKKQMFRIKEKLKTIGFDNE